MLSSLGCSQPISPLQQFALTGVCCAIISIVQVQIVCDVLRRAMEAILLLHAWPESAYY